MQQSGRHREEVILDPHSHGSTVSTCLLDHLIRDNHIVTSGNQIFRLARCAGLPVFNWRRFREEGAEAEGVLPDAMWDVFEVEHWFVPAGVM